MDWVSLYTELPGIFRVPEICENLDDKLWILNSAPFINQFTCPLSVLVSNDGDDRLAEVEGEETY